MKEDLQQHSMSSRALVLMISLLCSNRRFAAATKAKAVTLIVEILRVACHVIGLAHSFVGLVFDTTEGWKAFTVSFDGNGHSNDMEDILKHHPGSLASWNALMASGFCGYKLTSSPQNCSIWDLLIFLTWAKTNPSVKNVWSFVGQHLWPRALLVAGQVLDKAALKSRDGKLEAPALLKTRKGGHRRVPFVNRMMLLQKVKSAKRHRRDAMETHQDLVPKSSELVTHEQIIEVGLYLKLAQKAFQNACHFSIAWDPSTYDTETLVSCLWSNQVQKACYPPIQNMCPLLSSDLEEELRELAAVNKLTRIQGFAELRGLSHSMAAFGWPLQKFVLTDVHWRPLKSSQKRVRVKGQMCIQDCDGKTYPQVPVSFDIQKQPLLHSITDQGSLNRASLDYIQYKLGLAVLVSYDPYHRVWNDLRDCLKKCGTLWKTFLSCALFFNINYGPSGSKAWFDKKVSRRKEFLLNHSPESSTFMAYLPAIQRERRLPEPSDPGGVEEVFNTLHRLNSFNALGPVAKLMRWFSWFEAEKHYRGEVWMTKMVMLDVGPSDGIDFAKEDQAQSELAFGPGLTPKEELNKLKQAHGCYSLAALLITPTSMFQKDLIATICQPLWYIFGEKASKILKPVDVEQETIGMAAGGWKRELCSLISTGLLDHKTFRYLYQDNSFGFTEDGHHTKLLQKRLETHAELVVKLLVKRSSSLAAQYLRPPFRYAPLLDHSKSKVMQEKIQSDWTKILAKEAEFEAGHWVPALELIHVLRGSFVRLFYLMNEKDLESKSLEPAASVMMGVACRCQGDSACIENTHQSAKDILRDARHNIRSRVHKQFAVQQSRMMVTRKWDHIQVEDADKACTPVSSLPKFTPFTHPGSHKLNKEFQRMMEYKSGQHWWPATTAQSLFNEVCAFEFLFNCPDTLNVPAQRLPSAELCCLANPGSIIASKKHGSIMLVLATGSFAFLAVVLEVVRTQHHHPAFKCSTKMEQVQFHYILDVADWVEIPCQPALLEAFGPLVFQQVGSAVPLAVARVQAGLSLTVAQTISVLQCYQVELPSNTSRAKAYQALIDIFIQDPDARKAALEVQSQ